MLNCLISMLKEILTFLNKAHEAGRVITHTPATYIRACVCVCTRVRVCRQTEKGKEERREKGEKGGTGKSKEWRQGRRRREKRKGW